MRPKLKQDPEITQRRPSVAKWYSHGKINAKIRYFEPKPVFEVTGKQNEHKLYNYDVKTTVKTFEVHSEPTKEIGTSLIYVQNVEMKHAETQVDFPLDAVFKPKQRQRRWSFDDSLVKNQPAAARVPRKRCCTETTDSVDTLNENNQEKLSDSQQCLDITVRKELKENYQTYSLKSDNLLSSKISNRYNSTTCLQFSQFFLTRNARKISIQLTDEEQLDFVTGPRTTLWQKLPQVLKSGCLQTMTKKQIMLQEALFEIVYSEGRYLHSLEVLENHFIRQLRDRIPSTISEKHFNLLFSKIEPIVKFVKIFMEEMNSLLENDETLHGLCDIIQTHYRNSWDVYLKYAKHSEDILNLYQHEISKNQEFIQAVTVLSNSPEAEKLPLDSFLSLPIQRITKLPLLLKSVISQANGDDVEYKNYLKTLAMAEQLAHQCNREVGLLRECVEMLKITQEIEFPNQVNLFPLGTSSRKLCIRSHVKRFSKHYLLYQKERIEMFLFNDLFLFARKQTGSKRLLVCEYCPRSALTIVRNTQIDPLELQLLLRVDSQGKQSTLVVMFESMSERQRWVTALTPPPITSSRQGVQKQVIVKKRYTKKRPDELNLEIGDLIDIIHENGGWCNGKRLIDGETGWFPLINCHLIMSEWVRNINSRLCLGIQINAGHETPS